MSEDTNILICEKPFVTGNRVVRKGETFSDDHELVKGREMNFRSINDSVHFGTASAVHAGPVETASAAPGEKRKTQRQSLDRSKATRPRRRA